MSSEACIALARYASALTMGSSTRMSIGVGLVIDAIEHGDGRGHQRECYLDSTLAACLERSLDLGRRLRKRMIRDGHSLSNFNDAELMQ